MIPVGDRIVHVYPLDDLIEHVVDGTDCICGPRLELAERDGEHGWLVVHHSLDGRERYE